MTLLHLDRLAVRRDGRLVVRDATLSVGKGEFVGLVGPNGAGKTSLMRAALGLLSYDGRSSIATAPDRDRIAAWLPQQREIAWPMRVRDLVGIGGVSRSAAARALEEVDLVALADRPATSLSGGEQARALLARALARNCPLLMADEPLANLDPSHQIATMELLARTAKDGAVIASLHDLGMAARYCTRILVMHQGRVAMDAPPAQALTPRVLADVFGITAYFSHGPDGVIFQILSRLERT